MVDQEHQTQDDAEHAAQDQRDGNWWNRVKSRGITKGDVAKFSVLVAILAGSIAITVALWPFLVQLTSQEGIKQVTQIVRDAGPWAVFALLALELVQVIVAFIPGELVQIVAGMLYGPLWGSVLVLVGALLSTMVIYKLVRKLGTPFVQKLVPQETRDKFEFITGTSRIDIIVFIVFLIPAMPKDALTYLVALTDVKPSHFFLFSTLGRAPGIIVSSFAGSSLAEGNWIVLIVICVAVAAVFVVFFFMRDKITGQLGSIAQGKKQKEDDAE